MTNFEDDLKQALKRQAPGADFTARVLARCAEEDASGRTGGWRMFWAAPWWRLVAVVGALVLVTGGTAYEQHERQVRGMEAKRRVMLAMRIAGTKLQEVQQRVRESEQVEE
jgi:hypothetical protein